MLDDAAMALSDMLLFVLQKNRETNNLSIALRYVFVPQNSLHEQGSPLILSQQMKSPGKY